jgi:hypothetical protein
MNLAWHGAKPETTNQRKENSMAIDKTRKLSPAIKQDDLDTLAALKDISGYTPANPAYTLTKVQTAQGNMDAAQDAEVQAQAAADAARDVATTAEWAFHDVILGVKEQVRAQFGTDSNELQAIGLKKKSEKARPGSKTKKPATP